MKISLKELNHHMIWQQQHPSFPWTTGLVCEFAPPYGVYCCYTLKLLYILWLFPPYAG